MPRRRPVSRWKIILRAWPPAGAVFVLLSFLVTAFWLWHAISAHPEELGWLEPLAAFLAGTGAFILAAILIFRRVDSARAEADTYGLARGLATGYYFNFVRPLVVALSDPDHSVHADVAGKNEHKLVGMVVGLPQSVGDFDPARHAALLNELSEGPGQVFRLEDIEVTVEGRPRPVFAKLVLSETTEAAVLVDIPTTLTVIADFARFLAEQELGDAPTADDAVVEAREKIVADSQTDEFRDVLTEFIDVVNRMGSMEPRKRSPASLLHVVPMRSLRHRMEELAQL